MRGLRSWLYRLAASAVALLLVAGVVHAQGGDVTITGRVTNEAGAPLAGVNVFLEGMNIGTQTGDDGRYSFVVGANRASGQTATLTARVIGYASRSTQVTLTQGETLTQDFVLAANPLRLGEVVVTGAGTTTTRERLANVINSVDSSLIRRAVEPQNVVSALAGKAPNVDIRTQSGDPGASASIKIRGNASLSGTNQPLFVVDGQPIDNQMISTDQSPGAFPGSAGNVSQNRAADINPNDIESIEILKGSAAAAIYGARAANGVILITTKRGRAGPTQVSFNSTTGWDRVIKTVDLQQSYGQGVDGVNYVCSTVDCSAPGANNTAWGALLAPGTPTFAHGKEIFDTGLTFDNNLSVSGGNERTTFYASGGLARQNGVIKGPNNRYNRMTVRLKASHQVNDELNLGGNFNYIDARGRYVQKGSNTSGLLLGALRTPPDFNNLPYLDPETGLHRSYRFQRPGPGSATTGRGYDNPFFTMNNNGNRSELGRAISNINADWNPLTWLSVKYTLGGDYYNDWRLEALPLTSSNFPTGYVIRNDINNLEVDHNLLATATHSFNENISGELTLGQNLNSRRFRMNTNFGRNLVAPDPFALQNTVTITPSENRTLQHAESYFAQASLDLYNQVYVTLGLRNDGFSTFGASKRRHNFPKASVAWTFSDALGNRDRTGLFSYGKLRFAYGETGKAPEDVYGTITAFNLTNTFGSGFSDLLNASQGGQGGVSTDLQLGNSNLRPERSKETEIGVDLAFFNQMVDLGFTYYNKKSSDIILTAPVSAAATGSIFQLKNAASMTNQGIELTLNARPITTERVAWDIGFNLGRNRNRVTSLAGAEFITYNNEGFTGAIGSATVGFPAGVLRGFDFVRCRTAAENGLACEDGADPKALYLDADGFPVVDPTERVIADPNPKYTMGINTSVKLFNQFTLSTLFDIRRGFSVWNGTRGILLRFGTLDETLIRNQTGLRMADWYKDVYPSFAGPGRDVAVFNSPEDWQNWFLGEGGGFGQTGVQFVEDGSFVKWRELSLTYTVGQRWLQRTGFRSADIRIAGRNLHTWTRYKGMDPETNLGGAEWLTQGVDYFGNPQTRSFVLSISLNR
jgi:TonB-linked SusC/RagA family outer membrane protein